MFHLNREDYSILFNEKNSSFAIQLYTKPVLQTRDAAVNALAIILSIRSSELCGINIYVGTTEDIDPEYAGKNLGLGICNN